MIGKSFWEDLEIDALGIGEDVKDMAHALIDHWGSSLTEKDLLNIENEKI